jgi:hypothetical protein
VLKNCWNDNVHKNSLTSGKTRMHFSNEYFLYIVCSLKEMSLLVFRINLVDLQVTVTTESEN